MQSFVDDGKACSALHFFREATWKILARSLLKIALWSPFFFCKYRDPRLASTPASATAWRFGGTGTLADSGRSFFPVSS